MTGGENRRRYRKRARAVREEETRLRITEVLVELHGTIGPAKTTVTEVAARAGVSRMTVYNHFPDDAALFEACSNHWFEQNPPPDPGSWAGIQDPARRLRQALGELYAWYRSTQTMMDNVLRDEDLVPAVTDVLSTRWWPYVDLMVVTLSGGWTTGEPAVGRTAALRLAVDFRSWQVLAAAGLDEVRAAALASRMVICGAAEGSLRP